ncbi:MAG: helix-turn-helix domain-containing protein [Planctomycetota bacterium]
MDLGNSLMAARHVTPNPKMDPLSPGSALVPTGAFWCWRPRGLGGWMLWTTLRGTAELRLPHGQSRLVGTNEVVLLAPTAVHDYGPAPGSGPWQVAWAAFRAPATWARWLAWPEAVGGIAVRTLRPPIPERVTERLLSCDQLNRARHPCATSLGMNALEAALLWCQPDPVGARLDPRLGRLLDSLHEHPEQRWNAAGMARRAGVSQAQLRRLFQTHLGSSPRRYLEELRFARVRELLQGSALSVAAIATAVGFANPFHFSERFASVCGLNPSRWRKRRTSVSKPDAGGR